MLMTNRHNPRIVVIDDDDSVSEPIRMLIELHGWEAKSYHSCEAFLADLDTDNLPSCMILDLYFPRMNGVELQQSLVGKDITIPTIVLTARPDGSLARSSIEAGALEIITKPVKSDQLIEKIEAAIN
jgi:FixJ family two-component response regulator